MRVLYLIPARKGSKGLPGKNVKLLAGKPLVAYSIETALSVTAPEHICVTTDCPEVIKIANDMGVSVPFVRPAHLASDVAGSYEVIMHAINHYQSRNLFYDFVMLLQPTSPFREGKHLMDVLNLSSLHPGSEMIVSVREAKDNPYFNLFEQNSLGYLIKSKPAEYSTRQECPKVYAFNGSIYLMRVEALKGKKIQELGQIVKYEMSAEHSIDIDSQMDWHIAEYIKENFIH